jgi:endonuclease G, mitochondrial
MANAKNESDGADSTKTREDFMEKLKAFIRTRGAEYLKDPNITSVGIGYKETKGKRTKDIAVQFTVARKARPEDLAVMNTTPIPESFVIDGEEVPTDVLQRTYEPAFKIVAEPAVNDRKTRINPIVPGVSVGHTSITAGTISCIVFDKNTGTPYILSNWHVLHGNEGEIGDPIVQPGPHDDNRIDQNHLGKLVRSHLGAAGDCAIATIEDRTFEKEILDLGVPMEQLGEPDLDDRVVKSGRTTGVTHGIVVRIHTVARIDYEGLAGEQDIGCFEIGQDPDRPAANGEISMGGDSGSAWVFKAANGRPTRVMAGLHFAGESSLDPDERALACYPRSVFEKLEISLTQPDVPLVDNEASMRTGYNANFLGTHVPVPTLTQAGRQRAFKRGNSEVILYTHFSLVVSKARRFPVWVAWNIDGGNLKRISRKNIPFILDPDVPAEFQAGNALYSGNRLDRGHIARRADLLWGGDAEARQANRDSFFFTNITPQMDDFNQSSQGGIWGKLEDAVFADVDVDNLKVSVVGGPVFHNDDRVFRGIAIPREFYKVIAFVENGRLKARAFLLTQSLNDLEALDLDEFRVFQVSLAEIEARCDFRFPDALTIADSFAEFLANRPEDAGERQPLATTASIRW